MQHLWCAFTTPPVDLRSPYILMATLTSTSTSRIGSTGRPIPAKSANHSKPTPMSNCASTPPQTAQEILGEIERSHQTSTSIFHILTSGDIWAEISNSARRRNHFHYQPQTHEIIIYPMPTFMHTSPNHWFTQRCAKCSVWIHSRT